MSEDRIPPPAIKRNWKAFALSLESRVNCLEEEKGALQAELLSVKKETQLLIEKAPTAIYEIDFRGPRFTTVNDAMCQVSGYSREELLAMNPFDLLDAASKDKFKERVIKSLRGDPIDPTVEYKVIAKDGHEIFAVLNTTIRIVDGKPCTAFVIAHDVTERKTADKERERLLGEAQAERDRISALVSSMQDEVWFADVQKRITLTNPAALKEFMLEKDKVVDVETFLAGLQVLRPDGSPRTIEESPALRALKGEVITNEEEILRLPDSGELRYRQANTAPVRGKDGQIIGSVAVVRDITKRKQTEKMLEQKNMMLALLIDAAAELMAGADPIDKLDDFFHRASDALGLEVYVQYNLSEDGTHLNLGRLAGFPDRYLSVLSRLELGQAVCGTVAQIRKPIYVNNVQEQKDKKTRLIRKLGIGTYACHPLIVGDRLLGTLSFGSRQRSEFSSEEVAILRTFCNMVAVSIGRKQDETALQESEERANIRAAQLQAVLDALPVGVSIQDKQGGISQANHAFTTIWGGPGPSIKSIQDYQDYRAWWSDSGKEVAPEEWAAAQAVQQGKTVIGQILEIQRFDGSRAYAHNSASPVRDPLGNIVGSAVAIQDITHLHETEQLLQETNAHLEQSVAERTRQLQETYERAQALAEELEESLTKERYMRQQLIQAEKYAALTRLVASVAHEINNPLQTLQNCIFLLRKSIPSGDAKDIMDIISTEGNRMSSLVQLLRETYRPSNIKLEDFNLVDVLSKSLTLISPQLRDNKIELQVKCDQDQIIINGVPDQIKQVFINIILNAIDAMEASGGQLNVAVSQEADQVCIAFQDTGVGIPAESLGRIFEPFFTTKGKGTGLGLAICYEIIKDHQGAIRADSTPGNGATFTVCLPTKTG